MFSQLILSSLFAALVKAQGPSIPCISGTCTYQAGDGSSTAYSVLTINTESATSLSDITEAAGWDIIECDPYSVGLQDIRLVCTDSSKGCDHLFEGGAENTIVRLPDSCAGGPFARVVRSWISDNQTLPAHLRKRQIDAPVRGLTLDFDFSQIPESNGKVYITASATNSQAQRDAMIHSVAKRSLTSTRHVKRSSQAKAMIREFVEASEKRTSAAKTRGSFDWIGDTIKSVGSAVSNAVGAVSRASNQLQDDGDAVASGADDATHAVANGVQEAAVVDKDSLCQPGTSIGDTVDIASGVIQESAKDGTNFNGTFLKHFPLVDIEKSFPVLTADLTCSGNGSIPEFDASVSVTAAVRAKLDADFGFIFIGSIVPPKIDDFAFTAVMSGNVAAVFDITSNLKGSFDTGAVALTRTGIPGLIYPGILTVGPYISLDAEADVSLGVTADLKVSSHFDLHHVGLVFPPRQGRSGAQVTPKDTPVKVAVGTSVELEGRAEVHIIPRIDIGIKVLEGAAKTTVFLEVDGSAGIDFKLSAATNFTLITGDPPVISPDEIETKFKGTLDADEGVSITAGATAALNPLFDQTLSITLFQKTFPLVTKPFWDSATGNSTLVERAESADLICPGSIEFSINKPILDVPAASPNTTTGLR